MGILALLFCSVALTAGILAPYLLLYLLKCPEETVGLVLIAFVVVSILALLFVHLWSVRSIELLSAPHLLETTCDYCGAPHGKWVCGACQSLQWHRLLVRGGSRLALAAFIAHHRFKLLAAVLSVSVIEMLAFSARFAVERSAERRDVAAKNVEAARAEQAKTLEEKRAERLRNEDHAREAVAAMADYRAALIQVEALCSPEGSPDEPSECGPLRSALVSNYFRFSWYAPVVLVRVLERCRESADNGPACWWLKNHPEIVSAADEEFRHYVTTWTVRPSSGRGRDGPSSNVAVQVSSVGEGSAQCASRVDVARKLYVRGRRVGCILARVSQSVSLDLWDTFSLHDCGDILCCDDDKNVAECPAVTCKNDPERSAFWNHLKEKRCGIVVAPVLAR